MNRYFKILIFVLFALFISGCGKAELLPTGTESDNSAVLFEGIFEPVIIDTSFIPSDFYVSDSAITSDGYEYILTYYDYSAASNKDYYVDIDKSGNTIYSDEINKPIYLYDGRLKLNSVASTSIDETFPDPYSGTVNYSNFKFDEEGGYSAICQMYCSVYSDILMNYYTNSYTYLIKWNSNGECVSVEKTEIGLDDSSYDYLDYYVGFDGNKYKNTNSGIILLDDEGNYKEKYFDFLNSGIYSYGFNTVNILDSDSFCAVYTNSENKNVLCCFIRKKGGLLNSAKPIVLACTYLDNDLKNAVYSFNSEDSGYKITINDYSDRCESASAEEAWYLLKNDIIAGYKPDILLNTTGYDKDFINRLVSDNLLVDLTGVMKKDDDLGDVKFTDLGRSLFYSEDKIYSIVPFFEYDTIVGSSYDLSEDVKWDHDGFMNYASANSSTALFNLDTKNQFLERFLRFDGFEFIDYSNNTASFDSETFIKYLKFINDLPADYSESSERQYSDGVGYYLLSEVTCDNLGDMDLYATLKCTGPYVDLGFPSSTGGSGVINSVECYMIFSGRAYTNESWEFVKRFLYEDAQKASANGIPVTVNGFISWRNNLYPVSSYIGSAEYFRDGEFYSVELLSEEGAKYIIDHISSFNRFEFSDYKIEQIVKEYAEQYFEGKISPEEAAKSIDQNVETYLNSY